jgi:hypothetical protein
MKAQKRNELRKIYMDIFGGTLVPHTLKFSKHDTMMLDACQYYTELTGYGVLEMTPHSFLFKPFKQGKIKEYVKELEKDTRNFYTSC